ncbi:MAG TPA: EF-hand domain-containing protein [Burkholderiales bacterium]|nr:EF-hand domain-containing protein [Burkholderiales bacterium]
MIGVIVLESNVGAALAQQPTGPSVRQGGTTHLPEVDRRFDAMDRNGDGVVTREEARAFVQERERRREQREIQLRQRMDRADIDGSGTVSRAEARRRMPRVYEHFDEIDVDHDGTVTAEEIRNFWRKRAQQRRVLRDGPDPRF